MSVPPETGARHQLSVRSGGVFVRRSRLTRVTPPQTGNREFRDEVIRIAELTVREPHIDGYTFVNCRILGPAVLAVVADVALVHCTFEADLNSIFWEIDPEARPTIFGAVGVTRTTFSACTFEAIGIAGTRELRDRLDTALT